MEEKEASRQAIAAIEKEFLDRFQSEREGNRQMKNEFENLAKENVDLKELLKLRFIIFNLHQLPYSLAIYLIEVVY